MAFFSWIGNCGGGGGAAGGADAEFGPTLAAILGEEADQRAQGFEGCRVDDRPRLSTTLDEARPFEVTEME